MIRSVGAPGFGADDETGRVAPGVSVVGRVRLLGGCLAVGLAAGWLAVAGVARAQDEDAAVAEGTSAATAEPTASGWRDGAQVYANVCGHCHESGVGPAILGRQLPTILVTTVVRRGSRAMPAFRPSEIDDEALARVADFVASH